MAWYKFYVAASRHPKIRFLSDPAKVLLAYEVWSFCAEQKTNGAIPERVWRAMGPPEYRQELVDARLVEATESGVRVHDWLDHQVSREQQERTSQTRAKSGRKGGRASGKARRSKSQTSSNTQQKAHDEASLDGPPF